MKFIELKKNLQTKIEPVYAIFGADNFLVNKSIELVIGAVNAKAKEDESGGMGGFGIGGGVEVTRYDEGVTASNIVVACTTVSMFGGRRIIIVRGISDGTIKDLAKYFKKPDETCILVLVISGEKLPAGLKSVEIVDCAPLEPSVLVGLISNQLKSHGKQITSEGASVLAMYCGNSYARIDGEINKLVNFYHDVQIIDKKHIEESVTKAEEFQVYELGSAVCKKDFKTAENIMSRLLTSGVEEYAIFGALVSHFKRVWYAVKTNADKDVVATALKLNPWAVVYARRDNKHLAGNIDKIYHTAIDLEFQIKSGQIGILSAIQTIIMSLV